MEDSINDTIKERIENCIATFQNVFLVVIGNEIQWNNVIAIQYIHHRIVIRSSCNECRFLFAPDLSQAINIMVSSTSGYHHQVQFSTILTSERFETVLNMILLK